MDFKCLKHPIKVDGVLAAGTQFDLEVTLPEDRRDVIYGVIKDCFKCPVRDAVVKLVEVREKPGKDELLPVSHTFTNKNGEFVFGPLCPDRKYEIEIWADRVDHEAICVKPHKDFDCLKGVKIDCDNKDCDECNDHKDDKCEDKK